MISHQFFKDKVSLKDYFSLIINTVKTGKTVELFSFLVWEIMHKTGIFKKAQYLKFKEPNPLIDLENTVKEEYIFKNLQIKKSDNWKLIHFDKSGNIWGCLYGSDTILYNSIDDVANKILIHEFSDIIEGIYISAKNIIFVSCGGKLYRSSDKGKSFNKVLEFSSPRSYFLHNNAFTERPNGDLFVGEYVCIWNQNKWHFAAYLYFSKDNGQNWYKSSFLKKANINKHIHLLKYCDLVNALVLTDGDNKKNLWLNFSENSFDTTSSNGYSGWKRLTKFHIQKGGHTAMVELDGKVFFGSDNLGGTNFFISTRDLNKFTYKIVPDPYRRAFFTNMVVRKNNFGCDEIWATLHADFNTKTKSLLLYSNDYGKKWTKVIEYDGSKYKIKIISSSLRESEKIFISIEEKKVKATTMCISNSDDIANSRILPFSNSSRSLSKSADKTSQ